MQIPGDYFILSRRQGSCGQNSWAGTPDSPAFFFPKLFTFDQWFLVALFYPTPVLVLLFPPPDSHTFSLPHRMQILSHSFRQSCFASACWVGCHGNEFVSEGSWNEVGLEHDLQESRFSNVCNLPFSLSFLFSFFSFFMIECMHAHTGIRESERDEHPSQVLDMPQSPPSSSCPPALCTLDTQCMSEVFEPG